MPDPPRRRLLFLTPQPTAHANEVVAGALRAAHAQSWRVRACHSWEDLPSTYVPEGIIWTGGLPMTRAFRAALKRTPNVLISALKVGPERIRLCFDEPLAGTICARYFLERGFRVIAYVCGPTYWVDDLRNRSMAAVADEWSAEVLVRKVRGQRENLWFGSRSSTGHRLPETHWMDTWLQKIPKPAGLVCCSDSTALRISERCRRLGIAVPEQVSLLGIGNDTDVSENADPAISSLDFDFRGLGERAVHLLDSTPMSNSGIGVETFPPGEIVERASTSVVGSGDPVVMKAAQFIQMHIGAPLTVNALADACGASRTTLNNRFKTALGRSPGDEIKRQRLSLAQSLLSKSSLRVKEIAHHCGMPDPYHFSAFFKRETKMSPKQWRERHRSQPTRS